jgi:hypothetical protein
LCGRWRWIETEIAEGRGDKEIKECTKDSNIGIPAPIYWRTDAPCVNRQCALYDRKITTLPIEAGPFGVLIGNTLYKIEKITTLPIEAGPFGVLIGNALSMIEK